MRGNICLLLATVAAAGCGTKSTTTIPGAKKPVVGFVTNNPAEFWNAAQVGANKAAKEFEVEVLFRRPAEFDPAKQKEVVDTLLHQGVQGLAVSVIDPVNQKDYYDGIADKMPFVAQDNDVPDGKRVCYIGTINYSAGKSVGALIKEAMPDGGKLAVFVGQLEPLNARERRQGLLDELSGQKNTPVTEGTQAGKFTLVGTFTDGGSEQKAKDNAVDVLTKLTGEKTIVMVGLWGYNPPAILKAVTDKNRTADVRIIGFDEYPATLDGIESGTVYGTVVQNPHEFGFQSVKILAALIRKDKSGVPANKILEVPHRIITKTGGKDRMSVKDFRAEWEKLMGQ